MRHLFTCNNCKRDKDGTCYNKIMKCMQEPDIFSEWLPKTKKMADKWAKAHPTIKMLDDINFATDAIRRAHNILITGEPLMPPE